MPQKNPGGAGAKPPLPRSHRKLALSSNFTMRVWKSSPFPYDVKVEIAYDVSLENNSYRLKEKRQAGVSPDPGSTQEVITQKS
jgi:hypothetical protein